MRSRAHPVLGIVRLLSQLVLRRPKKDEEQASCCVKTFRDHYALPAGVSAPGDAAIFQARAGPATKDENPHGALAAAATDGGKHDLGDGDIDDDGNHDPHQTGQKEGLPLNDDAVLSRGPGL